MRTCLVALLVLAGGCKKNDDAMKTEHSKGKAVEKPELVLAGKSSQRLRELELTCKVDVDPKTNLVWVELVVHNHGEQPQFISAYTDELWMHDRGGQAAYAVGAPQRWPAKPPKEPVYATLAPQETRTWKIQGLPSPSPLPTDPPVQDFLCAAAIGPDGGQFLQAGGRAVNGVLMKVDQEDRAAARELDALEAEQAEDEAEEEASDETMDE